MGDERKLLDGLRRQSEKYREMVAVAEEQRRVLEGDDVDALLKLLDRKRGLLVEVDVVEKEIGGIKAKWPEMKAELDATTIREVERAVEETRSVLESLVKLEEEGKAAMERRRSKTGDELRDLMQKRKVRDAYGEPKKSPPETRFFDDTK